MLSKKTGEDNEKKKSVYDTLFRKPKWITQHGFCYRIHFIVSCSLNWKMMYNCYFFTLPWNNFIGQKTWQHTQFCSLWFLSFFKDQSSLRETQIHYTPSFTGTCIWIVPGPRNFPVWAASGTCLLPVLLELDTETPAYTKVRWCLLDHRSPRK